MDRNGKWQDEIKHGLLLPHEILATMFDYGSGVFENFAGQPGATCLALPSVQLRIALINGLVSLPQALDAYWQDEKIISPAFVEELVSAGVDLSCAIPFAFMVTVPKHCESCSMIGHLSIHVSFFISMYYVRTYIYICMHIYIYIRMYAYTCIYEYMCV